ncbi:MAG: heme exporter protein CcmD [Pseudomonadota bacterium]
MFGEHAAFILSSYAITFVALGVTTLVIMRNYRAKKAEIRVLEEKRKKQK